MFRLENCGLSTGGRVEIDFLLSVWTSARSLLAEAVPFQAKGALEAATVSLLNCRVRMATFMSSCPLLGFYFFLKLFAKD